MEIPFVSIIIASYNAVHLLPQSIDSVLNQNNQSIELIIIDGGSDDGTPDFLASYGEKITVWLSEPDKGIYDAWNKGISLATGEWIAFLGADDALLPNWFEAYCSFVLSNPELDFVSSSVKLLYPSGASRVIGNAWSWPVFSRYMNVAHVGSFHNRRLFTEFGLFDHKFRICGDYEFLLRPLSSLNAGYIDDVLVNMASGGVSDASPSSLWETFTIKWHLRSVSRLDAIFDLMEASFKWYIRRCLNYCRSNN